MGCNFLLHWCLSPFLPTFFSRTFPLAHEVGCSLSTFRAHGASPVCLLMLFLLPECPPPAPLLVQTIWDLGSLLRLSLCTALSTLSQRLHAVQSLCDVRLFATQWTAAHQASLSVTNSWSLLKFMSIKSVMPSNHLTLCCPLHSFQ